MPVARSANPSEGKILLKYMYRTVNLSNGIPCGRLVCIWLYEYRGYSFWEKNLLQVILAAVPFPPHTCTVLRQYGDYSLREVYFREVTLLVNSRIVVES